MRAWIFDVDGVLVHLEKHKVVEDQIIDILVKKLALGDTIALISGRAVSWQKENVIDLIHTQFAKTDHNPTLLDNLYLSGEFGGTHIIFENGKAIEQIDASLLIPKKLIDEAKQIVQRYAPDIIIDPKKTIFTVFSHSIERFIIHANNLIAEYQQLLKKHHVEDVLEVHKDTTAINIKYKKANKQYATTQVLAWIKEKGLAPEKYSAFGDSISDLGIGEELQRQHLPFVFVYVGFLETLPANLSFPVIKTHELFDKGTLEYLQKVT